MKNLIEHIEDFLAGNLSPKEELAFKSRMAAEPEFARDVEAQQQAHDIVEMYAKIKMKEKVKAIHQKTMAKPRIYLRRSYMVAASISLLIIMSCFWYAKTNFSNQALVANNIQLIAFDQRNINNSKNELSKKLAAAYKAKDYNKAISLLSTTPKSPSYNWEQFHLGKLYLQENKSTEAIATFQLLIENGDIRYMEDSQWLIVFAYLQNDDDVQAKLSLEKIIQTPDHPLYSKALKMSKKLNSFWRKMVL